MCFYLFAPYAKIDIVYAYEDIKILAQGSSEIRTEFFVQNCSPSPIEKLILIYPNSFIEKWRYDEFSYFLDDNKRLKDLSSDFKEPQSKVNNHYNKVPSKSIKWIPPEVIIEEDYPGKKNQRIEHKGIVSEYKTNVFDDEVFDWEEIKILDEIKFTFVTINCKESIQPGMIYAFKLFFNPITTCILKEKKRQLNKIQKLFDTVKGVPLFFSIIDPFEVKNKFIKELKTFTEQIENRKLPRSELAAYKDQLNSMDKKIFRDGLENPKTSTIISDYRILISLKRGIDLLRISEAGDLKKVDPFPEIFVSDDTGPMELFQFYTGKKYLDGEPETFSYRINISVKRKLF